MPPRPGSWRGKKPNSLHEWIIGCNVEDLVPKRNTDSKRHEIVTVSVSTDDEYESDTIAITYPRTKSPAPSGYKKVRFEQNAPALKSVLKKTITQGSDSGAESSVESNADSGDSTEAQSSGSEDSAPARESKSSKGKVLLKR